MRQLNYVRRGEALCRRILLVPMAALALVVFFAGAVYAAEEEAADISWPREFSQGGKTLTVYQPQVDSWTDYKKIHFRCAISVEGVLKEERFGVAEVEATTVVDHTKRMVGIATAKRTVRFSGVTPADAKLLEETVEKLNPSSRIVILSLDRVLACLDASKQSLQKRAEVNMDPPRIFYSDTPAILVMFLGRPKFEPVAKETPNLKFAVNTNWDVLLDSAARRYYLLNGDSWIASDDPINGEWRPAEALPAGLDKLPPDDNWKEVRSNIPGKPATAAPRVFVTVEAAELIVTDGQPVLSPIPQTQLSRVMNYDGVLFQHTANKQFYFLSAGRWFSSAALTGPWAAASKNLPPDFAAIPDGDPSDFVKSSVPNTEEAADAVLLASVPNTTEVKLTEKPVQVAYSGEPKFVVVEGTPVKYAVNTPQSVFMAENKYYCCEQGVWFTATSPTGPWSFCTSVPQVIYTIPPSNPHYNVTYVVVQEATPTTVVYAQTSGYSGEYVAATGVLMFGAGMLVGAAIADDDDHYYYPPCAAHYSYGCGATYNHGYGGYHASAHVSYGPYGGAGRTASYNPSTGTYGRSAYAYGPAGSARVGAAYNPYSGARAAGGQVNTAYGSAGRGAAYNPSTGNYARGAYASGDYGTAGAIKTNRGSAAAWNTENSQGAVAKTKSGNVYASNGDSVYKRESDGSWSSNSGNGWESANKPQPNRTAPAARPTPSAAQADSAARARQRGEQSARQASQWRSSGGASVSNSSRGGGGGSSGGGRSGGGGGGRSGGGRR